MSLQSLNIHNLLSTKMQNYKISPRGNFSPVKVSKLRKVTTIYYFGHAYETNKQYKFRNPDRYTPRIILTVP